MTDDDDTLAHYGTKQHSGRYPWGSGEDPYQSGLSFLAAVDALKKQGMTDSEISKGLGFESSSDYRNRKTISSSEVRLANQREAMKLFDKGMSPTAIGKQMGRNESSVRALLDPVLQQRANRYNVIASILKDNVDKYNYVDVGRGTENHMQISDTELKVAIAKLKDEGYKLQYDKVTQAGTGLDTSLKVLTKETTPWKDLHANQHKIHAMTEYIDPSTNEVVELTAPVSIKSKRVGVVYNEDGGGTADGVMYLRPGIPDISLGSARYAQVRIAVDGTHYIKGMAMYKENMPPGIDILFNTNKTNTGNKLDALKSIKEDADPLNPFGSMTRPAVYKDAKGVEHKSILNIINEEGDWYTWSNKFSSQFLSKQTPQLAKEQLTTTTNAKKADLNDILALTNPAVKRKLLQTFADDMDATAVKLKATGLPRTASHVILPINSLKDTEIYAPKYNDGETVVLVRHPHGGIFEIPELTVNNKNKEAARSIKNARDAVGINSKVAARLSGADFDGDHVLVIPNNAGKVKTSAAIPALKLFSPTESYSMPEGKKGIKDAKNPGALKQQLMGDISNLVTDMTIKGAHQNEIARAVKHSMVVIDAEKHNLDYKQSAIDQNINELKRKYQGSAKSGASTLISRTTSQENINKRKGRPAAEGGPIDKLTGERKYVDTGETFVNKQGKTVPKTVRTTKGAVTNDAHTLVSDNGGTVIERIYADYANSMKALANTARKEGLAVKNIPSNASAKEVYKEEIKSLKAKLNIAEKNAPRERQAQLLARTIVKAKTESNPGMDKSDLKKVNGLALVEARSRVGANKKRIVLTDNEWAAMQSGAITNNLLKKIVDNTDVEDVRVRATPRDRPSVNHANLALAQGMLAQGYSIAEISNRLGVSTSTLYAALDV